MTKYKRGEIVLVDKVYPLRCRPVAMMISPDDYESLLETIEILSDKDAVKRIKKAKREIAQGKTVSLENFLKRIEKAHI